jgi:hypothetical protein
MAHSTRHASSYRGVKPPAKLKIWYVLVQPVHTLDEAVASISRLCAKFPDLHKGSGNPLNGKASEQPASAT